MSYVDAVHLRDKDEIKVVERVAGQRVFRDYPVNHAFYYKDPTGTYTSIYGDKLRKFSTTNSRDFYVERNQQPGPLFESDVNAVFRCLSEHYRNATTPILQVGFFDIEVAFDPIKGYSTAFDTFNPITAISVYLQWQKKLVTLVLGPPGMADAEARAIADGFDDTILFDDEIEMLSVFIDLIDDCDVVSGWNSTLYDIPYIINRLKRLVNFEATRKLCLWDQLPRPREFKRKFSKKMGKTYDLVGRVHLDYLEIYQKHNTQQLHSYALEAVAQHEIGQGKTPYAGSLDTLYKHDFRKFIEYNRQDVMLLAKIDDKKKFIELSNQVAHGNTVLLKTAIKSVALIEQAILNEMHDRGVIAPDRRAEEEEEEFVGDESEEDAVVSHEHTPVVGAYVAQPKKGLHDEIGAVDISSLYPSTIRALNMSPETIFGQIRSDETMRLIAKRVAAMPPNKRAESWDGIFATLEYDHVMARDETVLTVDFDDPTMPTREMRACDLFDLIFADDSDLCITANGTVFRTDKLGIIPGLLARWYDERIEMQDKKKQFADLADQESDSAKKAEYKALVVFWDQRQLARKILLNSLYGALLNETMRFYDQRVGQSVTLNGRSIVGHQNATINKAITGIYDYKGEAIIYSDTDSSYFTAKLLWEQGGYSMSRDEIIEFYDGIGDVVNATFAEFMDQKFHTGLERGGLIKAARELVASRGLFIKKKKYAVLMYDKEHKRLDKNNKPGELKVMGLDLKRSDTPKYMQRMLEAVLLETLTGASEADIFAQIRDFRCDFVKKPGWEKGAPRKVNSLTDYSDKIAKVAAMSVEDLSRVKRGTKVKTNVPGHVTASLNYNKMRKLNDDNYSMEIGDGSKILVFKLRPNIYKMTSVAFPVDEPHMPDWFKELPFDDAQMEEDIIDKKLTNLVGVLDWDLSKTKESLSNDLFSFAKR